MYNLAYHSPGINNITNNTNRIKYVKQASGLIKKSGLVPVKKWLLRVENSSGVEQDEVRIPLWSINPNDGSKSPLAYIVILFAPQEKVIE